ncbi:hypothetical protein FAIPA1_430017 [Frankia sp. AiPs1]
MGEVSDGFGQPISVIADRFVDDGRVRVIRAGCRDGVGIEELGLEEDQCAVQVGELAPLLDLAGPDPHPHARFEGVAGEVDGVPQNPAAEREQVVERRALRDGEKSVAGAGAEPAEIQYLGADRGAGRRNEAEIADVPARCVSDFHHRESRAYWGVPAAHS